MPRERTAAQMAALAAANRYRRIQARMGRATLQSHPHPEDTTMAVVQFHTKPNPYPMTIKTGAVITDETCQCRHSRTLHRDTFAFGHGACATCKCPKFRWAAWTEQAPAPDAARPVKLTPNLRHFLKEAATKYGTTFALAGATGAWSCKCRAFNGQMCDHVNAMLKAGIGPKQSHPQPAAPSAAQEPTTMKATNATKATQTPKATPATKAQMEAGKKLVAKHQAKATKAKATKPAPPAPKGVKAVLSGQAQVNAQPTKLNGNGKANGKVKPAKATKGKPAKATDGKAPSGTGPGKVWREVVKELEKLGEDRAVVKLAECGHLKNAARGRSRVLCPTC